MTNSVDQNCSEILQFIIARYTTHCIMHIIKTNGKQIGTIYTGIQDLICKVYKIRILQWKWYPTKYFLSAQHRLPTFSNATPTDTERGTLCSALTGGGAQGAHVPRPALGLPTEKRRLGILFPSSLCSIYRWNSLPLSCSLPPSPRVSLSVGCSLPLLSSSPPSLNFFSLSPSCNTCTVLA